MHALLSFVFLFLRDSELDLIDKLSIYPLSHFTLIIFISDLCVSVFVLILLSV